MRFSSLVSRTAVGALLLPHVTAQWAEGGSFFGGSGAPGAASYQLVDDYDPRVNFFDKFFFYNDYDPTYGHVKYVNKSVALANGYAYVNDAGQATIKPDTTNLWPPGYADGVFAPGRPSVRVESLNTYTHGLFIFDATHLPTGCGTWPAYWLLGPSWPSNGEIDIIEGVNTYPYNAMTLHTTANCSVAGTDQSGALYTISCEGGCGSELRNETADPNNYGAGFNANSGGIYATEWTSNYIRHWWFPRGTEPQSITDGVPDVSTFGVPSVNHQGSCDMDSHFANMSIIVNIDFCGAWAGNVYQSQYPNCPQDVPKTVEDNSINRCTAFVGGYPQNLTEAYWEINRIQVYQMNPFVATTSVYSTSHSTASPIGGTTNTVPNNMGATTSTLSNNPPYTGPVSTTTSAAPVSVTTGASCPQYDGAVISDAAGYQYTLHCTSEYQAASAHVAETTSFDGCLVLCDGWAGCRGVTFAPYSFSTNQNGPGTCYSKETVGYFTSSGTVNAAVRLAGPAQSSVFTSTAPPTSSSSSIRQASSSILFTDTSASDSSTGSTSSSSSSTELGATSTSSLEPSSEYSAPSSAGSSATGSSRSTDSSSAFSDDATTSSESSPASSTWSSASTSFISSDSSDSSSPTSSLPIEATTPSIVPSSVALTTSSTWLSSESTYTSDVPDTTTSSTSLPAYSSVVTFVSTIASTWSSAGVTYSSVFPTIIVSTASEQLPAMSSVPAISSLPVTIGTTPISWYTSDSAVYSSAVSVTSVVTSQISDGETSAFSAPSSTAEPDSTTTSTSLPEYTSAGLSYSSTLLMTSISSASSTPSKLPPPACPPTYNDACGSDGTDSRNPYCSTLITTTYAIQCGIGYIGTTIPDSAVNITVVQKRDLLPKRVTVPNFASCQATCDNTAGCVASQFEPPTNCTLFSSVTGTYSLPGAVGAAAVPDPENPPTYVLPASATSSPPSVSTPTSFTYGSLPPVYGGGTTTVSDSGTITLTPGPTTTITPSSLPATTTMFVTTLPTGGTLSSSGNSSYYVISPTSYGGCDLQVCFTCGVTPVITDGCGSFSTTFTPLPSSASSTSPSFGSLPTTRVPDYCPRRTGYTTILTTYTMTTCIPGAICMNPEYVPATSKSQGSSVSYAPIPSTTGQPSITDLPTCAQGCVFNYGNCDPQDVKCICTNKPYLDPIVACVKDRCSPATVQAIYNYANKLCSGYGVEISTIVSYVPTTVVSYAPTTAVSYIGTTAVSYVPSTVLVPTTVISTPPAVTDLPLCAQGCVIGHGSCSPSDVKCICTNKPYLDPIVGCVKDSCSAAVVQAIYDLANTLCSGYGVQISTVVSYVPTTILVPTTIRGSEVPTTVLVPTTVQGPYGPTVTLVPTTVQGGGGGGPGSYGPTVTASAPTATVTGSAGNLPRCPYNQGQSYIDTNGQVYIINCDAAFVDTVIETSSQRGFMDCMTRCDAYNIVAGTTNSPGCGGINYNNATDVDNCQLTAGNDIGYSAGIWSGRLVSRAVVTVTGPVQTVVQTTGGGGGYGSGIGGGQITVISIQPGTTYIQPGTTYRETIVVTAPGGGTSVVTSVVERTVQQTVVSTAPGGGGSGGGSGYGGGQTTVLSVQPGTTYRETVVVTAPGGTSIVTSVIERTVQNTITGGTATVTQAGPTVTASGSGGGVVTVTAPGGGYGGGGQVTVTQIIAPTPASSSSTDTCRTYPTNYLKGQVPTKRKRDFNLGDLKPVPAARPNARPAYRGKGRM